MSVSSSPLVTVLLNFENWAIVSLRSLFWVLRCSLREFIWLELVIVEYVERTRRNRNRRRREYLNMDEEEDLVLLLVVMLVLLLGGRGRGPGRDS